MKISLPEGNNAYRDSVIVLKSHKKFYQNENKSGHQTLKIH